MGGGGGDNLFISPSRFNLLQSLQFSPVALCLLSTFLNCARKIVVIHCRRHDKVHREMGANGDVRDENAMAWHQCARTHGFQHSMTSSKATYKSGCGVSTMEMILLVTLSSISLSYMRYPKMRKCSSYLCMHCS